MGAIVPLLVQYGIPLAAYGIGHLVGWIFGKRSAKKGATSNVVNP